MDGMDYAIKLLQHGPTNSLSPCPPPPMGLAWWLGQGDKSQKMECKMKDWCLGALSKLVWHAKLA